MTDQAPHDRSSPGDLVQLGHLDIDAVTLDGGGYGLWELVGTERTVDVRAPREQLDSLPVAGWRRVHSSPAGPHRGRGEMLAAPYPDSTGRWATVYLAEMGQTWRLSTNPGPLPVLPGRAQRRESLELTWPDALHAPICAGDPDLHVVLTNVSSRAWINRAGDQDYVRGWLLDGDGRRIESTSAFVYTSNDASTLPDLEPGQSTPLPVHLARPGIETVPAGVYDVEAMLVQLNLRSRPGSLTLT